MPLAPTRANPSTQPWIMFVLATLPFLGLAFWRISWMPGHLAGDYAQYILHGQALLEGRAYADIGYRFHPEAADVGPSAYPPGLPLALLPLLAATGVNYLVLRVFSIACVVAFGWVVFRRLARDIAAPAAAVGAAWGMLTIEIQEGTVVPLSDPLFCAVLWTLFLVADTDHRWSLRRTAVVAALGFGLVALRVAGVVIGPALLLFALLRRQQLGARPFVVLALWGVSGLVALLLIGNPYAGGAMDGDLDDLGRKLFFLIRNYRSALFDAELYPFGVTLLDKAYHVLVTPLIVVGGVVIVRRVRVSLLTSFMAAYLVLLIVVRVGNARFLWPLLPLVGASLVVGLSTVIAWAMRWRRRDHALPSVAPRTAVIVPAAVILGAFGNQLGIGAPFTITGTPDATALYAWLRKEASQAAPMIMFQNPRVITLNANVSAMGVLDRSPAGQLVAIDAERVTHVITMREEVSSCTQRMLNATPVQFPTRFAQAFTNPTFTVYRVVPDSIPFSGTFERIDWRSPPAMCAPPSAPSPRSAAKGGV